MNDAITEAYRGWKIRLSTAQKLCAVYSFDIIEPEGKIHHVAMGGENKQRAIERAREMIDMELACQLDDR